MKYYVVEYADVRNGYPLNWLDYKFFPTLKCAAECISKETFKDVYKGINEIYLYRIIVWEG